jgi:hypothetical protein
VASPPDFLRKRHRLSDVPTALERLSQAVGTLFWRRQTVSNEEFDVELGCDLLKK